jgi:hypothetical protein
MHDDDKLADSMKTGMDQMEMMASNRKDVKVDIYEMTRGPYSMSCA